MKTRIRFAVMAASLLAVFAVPGAQATVSSSNICWQQYKQCMQTSPDKYFCETQYNRCLMDI
jgi:hypothetical protein